MLNLLLSAPRVEDMRQLSELVAQRLGAQDTLADEHPDGRGVDKLDDAQVNDMHALGGIKTVSPPPGLCRIESIRA